MWGSATASEAKPSAICGRLTIIPPTSANMIPYASGLMSLPWSASHAISPPMGSEIPDRAAHSSPCHFEPLA